MLVGISSCSSIVLEASLRGLAYFDERLSMLRGIIGWAKAVRAAADISSSKIPAIERQLGSLRREVFAISGRNIPVQEMELPHSVSESSEAVHAALQSVWNDRADEDYRQDQSHYRGVGRWKDDAAWQRIGNTTLQRVRRVWRLLDRPPHDLANLNVLEWGPGGGANAFGLRSIASHYYGIDISRKNLSEATRMLQEEGCNNYFVPILLTESMDDAISKLAEIDLFVSTAVFQHFPTKAYGSQVLDAIRKVCKVGAIGLIQIRFDNDNPRYKPIVSLGEYEKRHLTANSYRLEEFWELLSLSGYRPVMIDGIRAKNNYATFYMEAV